MSAGDPLFESKIPELSLLRRGKVRDIYAVDDEHLLLVATDRLSAYDVVLPDPIPGKGEVLTRMSLAWFRMMADLVRNQLTELRVRDVISDPGISAMLEHRALIVKRLKPLPVEAVVRGYLIGSGWRDYAATGVVCGIALPSGLTQAAKLPEPLFTPAFKAEAGAHDENITFSNVRSLVGDARAEEIKRLALAIYARAGGYARNRGIIIADTKFEFGVDEQDRVHLIDEVLTPDSSRFWPVESYRTGTSPPSFDKQFVRDYLDTLDWDKAPPAPRLPRDVLRRTSAKYREAFARLFG